MTDVRSRAAGTSARPLPAWPTRRAPGPEGGFADLKDRTGLRRFAMRGTGKAQGELLLACTAANVHLPYRHTQLA